MTQVIATDKERMTIVIVGHVDHGKSTVIGRLFADTDSLPEGKLEQVKAMCSRNARPFEYAFLLDALKDEQAQGITIDSARCFFKTTKRHYIIFDAPGHIEFLKNMVTGAAHAEAALLVIDAHEGVQENSKRHGYLLSMLGIKQVVILVNKMDLVGYDEAAFRKIVETYKRFLKDLNVNPLSFIPIGARDGENIASRSAAMPWYQGYSVLGQLDAFEKQPSRDDLMFRFPVQDIYKFTENNDDRRIIAGTIESGRVAVGDEVTFLPSDKRSAIRSIEQFNHPPQSTACAGDAIGFTLREQIYLKPGELMVKSAEPAPQVSNRIKANIFWMGKAPLIKGKHYKLKLATTRIGVKVAEIKSVIDASELQSIKGKQQVDRHDVAEIILETDKPIAFDPVSDIEGTGRFVIVDNYEIAGGGIVLEAVSAEQTLLEEHISRREKVWERGLVTEGERADAYGHRSKFVVLCGNVHTGKRDIAKALEKRLFEDEYNAYYLGLNNIILGLDAEYVPKFEEREEHIRHLGELARIMTGAGQIFITTITDIDDHDIEKLRRLNAPNDILVITVGDHGFSRFTPDLEISSGAHVVSTVDEIYWLLRRKDVIEPEYHI
jgi:bifunctional enzyme CysN/CysC